MNSEIEFLTDTLLEKTTAIEHGFFTRRGGVSEGVFSSLNCSYHLDNKDDVSENRHRVMAHLGKTPSSLMVFTDNFSSTTVIVDKPWDEDQVVYADAMVTNNNKIVLGALSADCPVVLFADTAQQIVGIAHAGWRSAKAGIIESCVSKMLELGAKTDNIVAAIGPCIAQTSYEVDSEFHQSFVTDDENNLALFIPSVKKNFFMFDLRRYVHNKLQNLSLSHSSYVDIDTYQDEKRFFSCRRSYHKNEKGYGCNLSFINLKE